MIGYVTLGTNDLEKNIIFYDELFKSIGIGRTLESDQFIAFGRSMQEPGLSLTKPFDGQPATVGNGTMVALQMASPEKVEAFYKKALELGATDEGGPGFRGEGGFYAAYFRDLDGNKLNAFCLDEEKFLREHKG